MKFIITEEQSEKLNQKVKSMVEKYGYEEALRLFDKNSDIIRRAYQDNPLSFLYNFNDLTPVEKNDRIFYVDKDGNPLFYYFYPYKNNDIYIDYTNIWVFFEDVIGLKDTEIKEILKNWLEEVYNLKGLMPTEQFWIDSTSGWKSPIN